MARDGLLLPWFSSVHTKFRTPFNAQILAGFIAALTAAAVPLEDLHHMVSIGTLFAFVVVSGSILIVRYRTETAPMASTNAVIMLFIGLILLALSIVYDFSQPVELFKMFPGIHIKLALQEQWVDLIRYGLMTVGTILTLIPVWQFLTWKSGNVPSGFKCPGVPLVPMIAMAANIYMMVNLNLEAWLRLFVWLSIGLVIYVFYGAKHSKLS